MYDCMHVCVCVCMFNNSATLKGSRGGAVLMCGGSQGNWSCILVRFPCRYLCMRMRQTAYPTPDESVILITLHICNPHNPTYVCPHAISE